MKNNRVKCNCGCALFFCTNCGEYKCAFCGTKIVCQRGVICILCVHQIQLEDECMRLQDPVTSRFYLLQDIRLNKLNVVELERQFASKNVGHKQCFLLQKYINDSVSCSLKQIAALIDNRRIEVRYSNSSTV